MKNGSLSRKSVLVLGSIAYDFIMEFNGIFSNNVSLNKETSQFNIAVMPHSKSINHGGTAGNIAYNLSLLKVPTQIITAVGSDFRSLGYEDHLRSQQHIEFKGDIHEDHFTASAYIVNDNKHNQMIIFHQGSMVRSPEIDLVKKGISKENTKIAIVSPEHPEAMRKWALELHNLGIPFILDPGQVTPALSREFFEELIPLSYIVIGNEYEIQMICQKLGKTEEDLFSLSRILIKTLGEKGTECYINGNKIAIKSASPSTIKDTTGAGDAFRAGLLFGLYNDLSVEQSCKIGTIVASYAIETLGPQTQKFSFSEIKKRYQDTFGDILEIEIEK